MNNNRVAIVLRRQHVFECVVSGMTTSQIAQEINTTQATVSKDIQFMVKDSEKYLNDTAKKMLPFIFKCSIEGLRRILYQLTQRYLKDGNLFALKLAIDCHKEILNMNMNGVAVMAVRRITDKANSLGITLEDGR